MKKILSSLLAAALLLACLAGCSNNDESPGNSGASDEMTGIPAHISIGTNPSGQSAYTMGAGIADVINKADIGTTVTVEETSGFPVNVQLMMYHVSFAYGNACCCPG